ncbi:hypothetical protein FQN52_002796 [Onygenales sp. PD_12]|nr:hypothetical protein FQN52_002796 [Onygenales sp. PD_12]
MTPPRRGLLDDEELAKKYDDRPLNKRSSQFTPFKPVSWKMPRRRRILLAFAGLWLLYLFFKNMPTDLAPAPERFHPPRDRQFTQQPLPAGRSPPSGPPPGPPHDSGMKDVSNTHYFGGPIKFYFLARSLYSVQGLRGYRQQNRIVLFAAADLKALADILPLACEMARYKLNRVHVAVMGRDEVSIEGIKLVNGLGGDEDDGACPVFWHDARPDYGPWSTDARMEASVRAGLAHIHNILRPSVIITHDDRRDEKFFWNAVKLKADRLHMPHINLPRRAGDFMWMSKLDSNSLEAWNKAKVEVLVHAPPASSGSLMRLLRSLQEADYFGPAPGLTIELPANVDPPLLRYLESFKWPPDSEHSHFTLRRRIQPHGITPEEAALRSIDSFYPKSPRYSHILVLSPQTDLSPSYYHFLKYAILKYKYSHFTKVSKHRLLGISLELPSTTPTEGDPFIPPKSTSDTTTTAIADDLENIPVFLWQAPNSNAALYFGDKWVEFQSFLSKRLVSSPKLNPINHPNLISRKFPSWMEYMLELIRARGYYLLYPSFPATTDVILATTHNELYHQPEEYNLGPHSNPNTPNPEPPRPNYINNPDAPLTPSPEPPQTLLSTSKEKLLTGSSTISNLLNLFPGGLPNLEMHQSDILPYSPRATDAPVDLIERTEDYLKEFRRGVGGCGDGKVVHPDVEIMKADDLFCVEKEEEEEEEEQEMGVEGESAALG